MHFRRLDLPQLMQSPRQTLVRFGELRIDGKRRRI